MPIVDTTRVNRFPAMILDSTHRRPRWIACAIASSLALAWCVAAPAAARDISFAPGLLVSPAANPDARSGSVVMHALALTGLRYRYGGTTTASGMDCSALIQHVFREAWQQELPRTAEEISRAGDRITLHELQAGDLVFFDTANRPYSHVGIYVGDNRFVHSPSPGGAVRMENMNLGYWKTRFNGARRIADNSGIE